MAQPQPPALDQRVVALEAQLTNLKRTCESEIARLQEQLSAARQRGDLDAGPASGSAAVLGNRVEWTITGLAEKKAVMQKGQSIYSNSFECAGIKGIQLEFYPNGRQTESHTDGFCSLFLWCPPGTNIKYYLFCQSYARAPDEDLFDARMGHGHSNFCFLDDQIDAATDSVKVGVEILNVNTTTLNVAADLKLLWTPLRDLIRNELQVLNNLAVDRVEWQITNISRVRKCWAKGTSIFSPLFTAAGVREIQFEFYPNGSAVTQGDGYCGFYMRCTDGTNVTITLFVGKHRKGPISAKFEAATGKGLPDFCDLEPQIDPVSDSVTVGIELRNNDWPPNRTLRV